MIDKLKEFLKFKENDEVEKINVLKLKNYLNGFLNYIVGILIVKLLYYLKKRKLNY